MDQAFVGGRAVSLGVVRIIRVVLLGLGVAGGFLASSISAFNLASCASESVVMLVPRLARSLATAAASQVGFQ